jgi:hypothetical protein
MLGRMGKAAKRNIVSQKQRKRNSGRCGLGTSGYKRLLRFYALRGGASGEFTGVSVGLTTIFGGFLLTVVSWGFPLGPGNVAQHLRMGAEVIVNKRLYRCNMKRRKKKI